MSRTRTRLAALALSLAALTGCSGGLSTPEGDLSDEVVTEYLDDLESAWREVREAEELSNVGEDARCYLATSDADGDVAPTEEAFCGPVAVLGAPDGAVWDSFSYTTTDQDGDLGIDGAVEDSAAYLAGGVPSKRPAKVAFYRPDGEEPAKDAEALEPPPAPAAEPGLVTEVVPGDVRVEDEQAFDDSTLITPDYTLRLLSLGEVATVGVGIEARSAADGEKFVAARLTMSERSDSDGCDVDDSCFYGDSDVSTQAFLDLGATRPDITEGLLSTLDAERTYVFSVPADGSGLLTMSVGGVEQSLSLETGERTTTEVGEAYYRQNTSVELTQVLVPKTVSQGDYESRYGINFISASLDAYDDDLGWAPSGSAWLQIPFEEVDDLADGYDHRFLAKGFTVAADGKNSIPLSDGYPTQEYEDTGTLVFEVPVDAEKLTFSASAKAQFSSRYEQTPLTGTADFGTKKFAISFS